MICKSGVHTPGLKRKFATPDNNNHNNNNNNNNNDLQSVPLSASTDIIKEQFNLLFDTAFKNALNHALPAIIESVKTALTDNMSTINNSSDNDHNNICAIDSQQVPLVNKRHKRATNANIKQILDNLNRIDEGQPSRYAPSAVTKHRQLRKLIVQSGVLNTDEASQFLLLNQTEARRRLQELLKAIGNCG
jgi:hypothetical protein